MLLALFHLHDDFLRERYLLGIQICHCLLAFRQFFRTQRARPLSSNNWRLSCMIIQIWGAHREDGQVWVLTLIELLQMQLLLGVVYARRFVWFKGLANARRLCYWLLLVLHLHRGSRYSLLKALHICKVGHVLLFNWHFCSSCFLVLLSHPDFALRRHPDRNDGWLRHIRPNLEVSARNDSKLRHTVVHSSRLQGKVRALHVVLVFEIWLRPHRVRSCCRRLRTPCRMLNYSVSVTKLGLRSIAAVVAECFIAVLGMLLKWLDFVDTEVLHKRGVAESVAFWGLLHLGVRFGGRAGSWLV